MVKIKVTCKAYIGQRYAQYQDYPPGYAASRIATTMCDFPSILLANDSSHEGQAVLNVFL